MRHAPGEKIEVIGRERIPMRRCGRADEVSSLIAWLASEDGACMTGQNLRIDGGLTRAV